MHKDVCGKGAGLAGKISWSAVSGQFLPAPDVRSEVIQLATRPNQ